MSKQKRRKRYQRFRMISLYCTELTVTVIPSVLAFALLCQIASLHCALDNDNITQESCAIAKMTARGALYTVTSRCRDVTVRNYPIWRLPPS